VRLELSVLDDLLTKIKPALKNLSVELLKIKEEKRRKINIFSQSFYVMCSKAQVHILKLVERTSTESAT